MVIGGYVNHAFIIEDNVYEIYPVYNRKYKLYDIKTAAPPPPSDILKVIKEEITRFYGDKDTNKGSFPAQHYADKNMHRDTTTALTLRFSSACSDNLDLQAKRHGR